MSGHCGPCRWARGKALESPLPPRGAVSVVVRTMDRPSPTQTDPNRPKPTQSDRPTDEREHQYITCPAGGQDRTGQDSRATGAGLPGSQQLTDELDRPIRTVVTNPRLPSRPQSGRGRRSVVTNVCPGGY